MDQKFCISIVLLALIITLKPTPTIAQQSVGQASVERKALPTAKIKQENASTDEKQEEKDPPTTINQTAVPSQVSVYFMEGEAGQQIHDRAEEHHGTPWKDPQWTIAFAAVLAAVFAALAFWASRSQADAAHKMFLLAQRPKLIVRNVLVNDIGEQELTGKFYVVNVGGTDAYIGDIHSKFIVLDHLPVMPPYTENPNSQFSTVIKPGCEHLAEIAPLTLDVSDFQNIHNQLDGVLVGKSVYVMGYVTYQDRLKTFRRSIFCRRFDYRRRSFVREEHSDYDDT